MAKPVLDEAFKTAGKKVGLEIWRINKFKVEAVPREQFGNFFDGDSYIVLKTNEFEDFDVHFWLGTETTQDEYGTAAFKTVELDQLLGGFPVQHREVSRHESALFLSYFKRGIKYLKGGYDTGFRHVDDPKFEPRLIQVKGRRNVRCFEVALSCDSLNLGDVFILDCGLDIYVWTPPDSGRMERVKAILHAASIRDQERAGRGNIHVIDDDWEFDEKFFSVLGGKKDIKNAIAGGKDEDHFRKIKPTIMLWKVSDASGKMNVQKVGESDLTSDMLDPNEAFILDTVVDGLYVWVGKECNMAERKKSMFYAEDYLKSQNRPSYTDITRVLQSGEPAAFTQWFKDPPKNRPKWKPHLFQCSADEGETLNIEEIVNFKQDDLDDDDVMILDVHNKVFVWIGATANDKEKASADAIAKQYSTTDAIPRPGGCQVVTINEGAEPVEFSRVFPTWDVTHFARQKTVESAKKLARTV